MALTTLVTAFAVVPARCDWIDAFPGGEPEQFWDFTFNPAPFVSGGYQFAPNTSGSLGNLTISAARSPLLPGAVIGFGVVPTESFAGRGVVVQALVNPSGTVPGGPNVGVAGMVSTGAGTGYLAMMSTATPGASTLSLVKATGPAAATSTLGTSSFVASGSAPALVQLETIGPVIMARTYDSSGRLLASLTRLDSAALLDGFAGVAAWEPFGIAASGNWGTTSARAATANGALTWAPTGSVPAGAVVTGTWNPTALTWISSTSTAAPVRWDATKPAVFAANGTTGGTVVVSGSAVRVDAGMRFVVDGYRLTSATATHGLILGGTNPVFEVDEAPSGRLQVATIDLPLTGTTGFHKARAGVLALTGTNTFSGMSAIAEGVLSISTTAALPGWNVPGRYRVQPGATLAVRNGVADENVVDILATGNVAGGFLGFDTFDANRTLSLNVTGSVGLRKIGIHRLTLDGSNTYSLGTIVNEGQLEITSTAALPGWNQPGRWSIDSSAVLVAPNAITDQQVDALLLTGNVGEGGFGFNTAAGDRSRSLPINGPQSLYKLGVNTLTLTGSSGYTGATRIDNGVLAVAVLANSGSDSSIGTGTASPTILIGGSATAGTLRYVGSGTAMTDRRVGVGAGGARIESAGTGPLVFTAGTFNAPNPAITTSSTLTLAGSNSGTNTIVGTIANTSTSASLVLVKDGTGTWILSGSNTYSGGTIVSAGSLIGTTTSLRGAITNNALVEFSQAASGTYAGLMSGSGSLTKSGTGVLTLAGSNTLSGSAFVQGGVLQLASSAALSASRLVVVAGGTGQVAPVTRTGVASLDLASGNGLMDLTSGAITIASGMTATELVAELLGGRAGDSWTGASGITSSTVAAQVAAGVPRAVGWIDNGDGSLTAAYAAQGDTNVDWSIDILDASNFLAGGKFDAGTAASWTEGDFSYDGVVDILDAADFFATGLYDAGSYNTSPGISGGVAAVPEPAGMGLLASAGVAAWLAAWVGRKDRRRG